MRKEILNMSIRSQAGNNCLNVLCGLIKFSRNDACILVSGTRTITEAGAGDKAKPLDYRNKGVTFKNCAPITDCISEINNT